MKKVLLLALALALIAQVAAAAGPRAASQRPGMGNTMGQHIGQMRAGLNVPLLAGQARPQRQRIRQVKQGLDTLEALAETDPAALKARLLERHETMVARAQALIANKATLPTKIVADLKAGQAQALARATEQAKQAADQEAAAKRLAALQARQTRVLAAVEKNAAKMAEKMIARAQSILENAPAVRARIQAGEGLDVVRDNLRHRLKGKGN